MDRDLLLKNVASTVKIAKVFGLPIAHSTINVQTGRGKPTLSPLAELLADNPPIDLTTTNAWEDADFLAAVRATGRRKLIMCALWTEICMAFPALDAMREGYEVYPVVDAIGGTSVEAHRAGLERVVQAGAKASWLGCARGRTAARLGAPGDRAGGRRDRADRAAAQGGMRSPRQSSELETSAAGSRANSRWVASLWSFLPSTWTPSRSSCRDRRSGYGGVQQPRRCAAG